MQHPAVQTLPAQQGALAAPHLTQLRVRVVGLVKQAVPGSVHWVPVVQHAWFSLPHSQMPALHVPL
jgi:hypothetical protein